MADQMSDKAKEELFLGIHEGDAQSSFEQWTEEEANKIARQLGLQLSEAHWNVIKFLRLHYENAGFDAPVHEVAEALEERFSKEGGLKYLYRLFPGGPVHQGCRIAGVPVPKGSADPSFGSVF